MTRHSSGFQNKYSLLRNTANLERCSYAKVLHNMDYLELKSRIKVLKLEKANQKLSKKSSKNPQQRNKLKKSQKLLQFNHQLKTMTLYQRTSFHQLVKNFNERSLLLD